MKSKTYFVSSINGSDSNDGLSPDTAFETLGKINEIKLMPGDKVLLEKDSVFSNQYLHIKNCGKFGEDIIEITSYGDGENMPRIDAQTESGGFAAGIYRKHSGYAGSVPKTDYTPVFTGKQQSNHLPCCSGFGL